jgi:hypothetical protein
MGAGCSNNGGVNEKATVEFKVPKDPTDNDAAVTTDPHDGTASDHKERPKENGPSWKTARLPEHEVGNHHTSTRGSTINGLHICLLNTEY